MGVARGRRRVTCRERCLAHDGETANPGREDHASLSTPSLHGYTGVSCRAGMITCQSFPGCWAGFTFRLKSHGQRNTGPLSSSVLPTCKGRFSCFIYSKAILPLLPFTANLDSVFPSKGDKNPAISHLSPDTSLGHPNRLTRLPLAGLPASPHPLPVSRQQLRHSSSKL